MGTNYYWIKVQPPVCQHCGRSDEVERLHIGKSSAGWCFALHVIPELGIADLPDWEKLWAEPGSAIVDEYDKPVTVDEMRAVIMARARNKDWNEAPYGYPSWERFHQENYSEQGPVGLLRHRLGPHCVAHGAGTWDCLPGEFS